MYTRYMHSLDATSALPKLMELVKGALKALSYLACLKVERDTSFIALKEVVYAQISCENGV